MKALEDQAVPHDNHQALEDHKHSPAPSPGALEDTAEIKDLDHVHLPDSEIIENEEPEPIAKEGVCSPSSTSFSSSSTSSPRRKLRTTRAIVREVSDGLTEMKDVLAEGLAENCQDCKAMLTKAITDLQNALK